jgi:hypothetical protein
VFPTPSAAHLVFKQPFVCGHALGNSKYIPYLLFSGRALACGRVGDVVLCSCTHDMGGASRSLAATVSRFCLSRAHGHSVATRHHWSHGNNNNIGKSSAARRDQICGEGRIAMGAQSFPVLLIPQHPHPYPHPGR